MASIVFRGQQDHIQALNGSGIGFYGSNGFASSVDVGAYQDATFITNSNGTTMGPQLTNVKWTHPNSGTINGGTNLGLTSMPNYLATVNVRFSHNTPVKTQNVKFRIYDRVNINSDASGVLTKVVEIIHPNTAQTATGSGSSSWGTPNGSGSILTLTSSPAQSGLSPNGPSSTDMTHDWYLNISASPSSIGSKTFAGYLSLEYL
jgi:hypothetical protein